MGGFDKKTAMRMKQTVALVSLMRDRMWRQGDASALRWGDIEDIVEGTGVVFVRRSKTDVRAMCEFLYVSTEAMRALEEIRCGASPQDSVFGMDAIRISDTIKSAMRGAGFGSSFAGQSPRRGTAIELGRNGPALTNSRRPADETRTRWPSTTRRTTERMCK